MAIDFQDVAREVLIGALGGQSKSQDQNGDQSQASSSNGASKGGLSGLRGLAMGAGAAALAPVAAKNLGKLANVLGVENPVDLLKDPGSALEGVTSNVGDRVTGTIKDKVTGAVDEAGGPSGILKDTVKGAMPFGGGDGGSKGGAEGVGQGRRMPVQQHVDIGAPIETVYNQWTQFEEWPNFMHRVVRATQEDDCTVSFEAKIWTRKREFTAQIETQRPNEMIKWKVSQGLNHTGIVTFHELGPRLTRVMIGFDVQPGGLIEKFARGARHIKRASRGDFHRFKAFIEMLENETGAWRGVIEEGELVEEHDPSYDEQRQYGDASEILLGDGKDEDDEAKEEDENADDGGDEEERSRGRRGRGARSGARSDGRQSSGRARAASGGAQSSRSAGGQRSSSGRSSGRSAQSSGSRSSSGGSSSRGRSSSGGSSSRGGSSSGGGSSSRGGSSSGGSSSRGRSSSRGGSSSGGSSSRGRSSSGGGSSRSSSRASSARGRSSGSGSGTQSGGRKRSSGSGSSGRTGARSSSRSRSNKS